mmetsp:Transcript_4587/g.10176  ORF Transcript_4587/g.10176 Transcript_4587/m.10176 type:complete len:486 (-) Transcript_4587:282-1739(-)
MAEDKKEPESNKAASTAAPPAKEGVSQTGNGASSGTDDAAADSGEGEEPCPKVSKDSTAKDARRHATPYAKKDEPADVTADGGAATQNCRVYVGNLSWSTGWRDLKDHMKACGDVLRADVMQTHDGRSKGCGIVEYSSPEEAARAVEELNNSELSGRQIFVREDREQTTGGGGGGGGGGGSNEDGQSKRVYVGNLSWDVAWQDLKDHMRTVGDVAYSEVMTDHDGRSKGCGIVEFTTAAGAKEAIAQLTDTELKGRMIFVREDREQGGGGHGGGGFQQGGRGGGGGHHGGGSLSVYVGNLAYETSWQDLKDHMRAAGNVDKADILKGSDGRSKGCGIVLYQKSHEAQRAIRELQNTELHGRPIFVREDREQGGGGGGSNNRHGGGGFNNQRSHNTSYMQGSPAEEGCQLFVGNLSWETGWRELKDHFRQCGEVDRAEVAEGNDGRKRGFGLVRFHSAKDAQAAIRKLNGVDFMGRPLDVRVDNKA